MRLRLGCELVQDFPAPSPLIAVLNVHFSMVSRLERPDVLSTSPPTPVESYRDPFGNWCCRLVAPSGRFTIGTDGIIRDDGQPDQEFPGAEQHPVESLPTEVLPFLLGSRYVESDVLSPEAWRRFGSTPLGWPRAKAVCDFVHGHIAFDYGHARATRTAAEAYVERKGVCRDFAHLAIAFCRALNIPARYCTGYVSDIGQPPPHAPMDFAAWIEVWLGGRWRVLDPRNNTPRVGRVLIATGRDAADVPLAHSFGPHQLVSFRVWIHEA